MSLEEELSELKKMLSVLLEKASADSTSDEPYGKYLIRWCENYKAPRNGKNTTHFMRYYITERISPALGAIPLNRLTGDDIQTFLNNIPGNNTRQKIALIIKGSLTKAVKLHLIKYSPFDAVEMGTYKKKHYRAVTLPEQTKIIDNEKNKLYLSVFWVLVCTGLRIGEFLAIRKDCIDYKERYINVWRSIDTRSGNMQNRTKTYTSTRRIPFLKELTPHLKTVVSWSPLTYNQVHLHFTRLYKSLKIKNLTLHSLRHTFGCMCYKAGISAKMIQHVMGHAELNVTMNVYVDILGKGESPMNKYFERYKNDLLERPADFWVFLPPEK